MMLYNHDKKMFVEKVKYLINMSKKAENISEKKKMSVKNESRSTIFV